MATVPPQTPPLPGKGPPSNFLGKEKGQQIQRIFANLNRKFQEQETQRLAGELSLPYFDLAGLPIDQPVFAVIPHDDAAAARAIPFDKEGLKLKVAIVEPKNPHLPKVLKELEKKKYQIKLYLVSADSFAEALKHYKELPLSSLALQHEAVVSPSSEHVTRLKSLPNLGDGLLSLSATELVNLVLGSAIAMRASDIHLEPEKNDLKVRFRVDGVLADIVGLPLGVQHSLLSRIKLLANLKLNITATSQDGRFSIKLPDKNLDVRVSVLPSAFGESVVMRILGMLEIGLEIEKLGLRGRAYELVKEEIGKPNGMILTTGPTGSGKTTTLYAFLNHLNRPGVKIITLEDPVEYQLLGVVQTPIDKAAGIDFATALRAILRQDPDIVMVGEIRDYETAETASQTALTGHIVLSTLHTNDAAGAIPRLLDLGVKPVTLAPALNALIAQRLLRKICEHCKFPYRPTVQELQRVKLALSQISAAAGEKVPERLTFFHGAGCVQCHHLGYKGRIGVFEIFAVDEKVETLIYQQASTVEIKKAALAQGMLTMQQDGILRAVEGITDLAEVWRVTEE